MATRMSSTTTPSPTELTCHDFHCFWQHCHEWVLTWLATASLDLICGCWALFELMHIYRSMQRLRRSSMSNTQQHSLFTSRTPNKVVQHQHPERSRLSQPSLYGAYSHAQHNAHKASRTKSLQLHNSPSASSDNSRSRVQMFASRLSQKLFLLCVAVGSLARAYLGVAAPFTLSHCRMTPIDTPTLLYAVHNLTYFFEINILTMAAS